MGSVWKKVSAPLLFVQVRDVYPDAMDLDEGPDGRIWLLTKYGVSRFKPGMEPVMEKILDGPRYRALFGHKMNALSALRVTGADQAWIGSWYGELFQYRNGRWRQLTRRGKPMSGRIRAIAVGFDGIYVGGRQGLWRWSEADRALAPMARAPRGEVNALGTDSAGRLIATVGNALWRHDHGEWNRLWQGTQRDGDINVRKALDGGWLVGTDDGVVRLSASGEVVGRYLSGYSVYSIAEQKNALWVATWGHGLVALIGKAVLPVKVSLDGRDKNLTDILVDRQGLLWLTIYGKGAAYARLDRLSALMRPNAE
ncbi:MAG: hypothetical protein ABFS02_08265, partial [Pseudomonadota bacterium]